MTAHAMAGDADKSLQAGMNDHVTKPIDPAQLFAAVQKWIAPLGKNRRSPVPQDLQPEAKEDDLPAALPGFDLPAGLKRLMGNRRLYRKLLGDFGRECRDAGPLLHDACAGEDFHQIDQLAHRLKGAAGNLGATQVQEAALALETLAKDATPRASELQTCRRVLEEALESALAALDTIGLTASGEDKAGKPSGVKAALPEEIRVPLVKRLREAADIGDIGGLNAIACRIAPPGGSLRTAQPAYCPIGGGF